MICLLSNAQNVSLAPAHITVNQFGRFWRVASTRVGAGIKEQASRILCLSVLGPWCPACSWDIVVSKSVNVCVHVPLQQAASGLGLLLPPGGTCLSCMAGGVQTLSLSQPTSLSPSWCSTASDGTLQLQAASPTRGALI